MNNFYANRYLATIEILKKYGLWDLEIGLLFMPIIQHCMPPPSIYKIQQLLNNLIKSEIDTDWAPHKVLLKLRKEVARHIYAPDLSKNSWATEYAIAYAIHIIAHKTDDDKIEWPVKVKAQAIKEFVEIIYEKLSAGSVIKKNTLYLDIYQLRDIVIDRHAHKNKIRMSGKSNINIEDKEDRILEITHFRRGIGSPDTSYDTNTYFWENPPKTQFCILLDEPPSSNPISIQKSVDSKNQNQLESSNKECIQNSSQQRLRLFSDRPTWVRNNVRSLSDSNQLPWGSIFNYWEFLLTKGRTSLFKMSVICFLTGIHKKSWINGLASRLPSLDSVHLTEKDNVLRYKLNGGAKDFFDDDEQNIMLLPIPPGLKLTLKAVKSGLKEESAVRSFNRRYSGPSPTLNNVCRSGHTLLRKTIKGETLAFIMSGRIPIEFQARCAYFATDSNTIQELFNNGLLGLKKEIGKREKQYPLVSHAVADINVRKDHCGLHNIGSQLASTNWHFGSFNFYPIKIKTIEVYIERTNQMVLYFFWMIQYSLATRPPGEKTESYEIGDFWLHRDKDSDRYFESKVLLIPDLLKAQKKEVHACINNLQSFAQSEGFNVADIDFESNQLCYYKATRKKVKAIPLLSNEAIKLTKQLWGLTPNIDRSNAYRHQCASYIHRKLGENHADTWLGHHIDGWCYSAPESAANAKMLSDVLAAQNQWLEELGFHLIKNPLS